MPPSTSGLENWGWYDPTHPDTYANAEKLSIQYFQTHAVEAVSLGKPLVVEEFGLARDWAASARYLQPEFTHHQPGQILYRHISAGAFGHRTGRTPGWRQLLGLGRHGQARAILDR